MLISERFAVSKIVCGRFCGRLCRDAKPLMVIDGKEAYGFDIAFYFLSGRRVLRLASGDVD